MGGESREPLHAIPCPFCDWRTVHDGGAALRPSEAIRMHERTIAHLRMVHSLRRAAHHGIAQLDKDGTEHRQEDGGREHGEET